MVAALLSAAAMPFLTRLYRPEEFGLLAVFVALVTTLGSMATGRYELAIPRHRRHDQAFGILLLATLCAAAGSLVFFIVLAAFRRPIMEVLSIRELGNWILLAPLALFCLSVVSSANFWFTRSTQFRVQAITQIVQSASRVAGQAVCGLAGMNAGGLVLGHVVSMMVGAGLIWRYVRRGASAPVGAPIGLRRMLALARLHRRLPQHGLSTSFINSVAFNLLPLVVVAAYGPGPAGLLLICQQIIAQPAGMLGQAIWRVTHGRLTPARLQRQDAPLLFRQLQMGVALLLGVPFAVLAAFSDFSGLVLGSGWSGVAALLPAFSLMVLVNTMSNCTSYFVAFGMYKAESVWNVVVLAGRVLAILTGPALGLGAMESILLYCYLSTAIYVALNLFWGLRLGNAPWFLAGLALVAFPLVLGGAWIGHGGSDAESRILNLLLLIGGIGTISVALLSLAARFERNVAVDVRTVSSHADSPR